MELVGKLPNPVGKIAKKTV